VRRYVEIAIGSYIIGCVFPVLIIDHSGKTQLAEFALGVVSGVAETVVIYSF
jgi:hypothetical protein